MNKTAKLAFLEGYMLKISGDPIDTVNKLITLAIGARGTPEGEAAFNRAIKAATKYKINLEDLKTYKAYQSGASGVKGVAQASGNYRRTAGRTTGRTAGRTTGRTAGRTAGRTGAWDDVFNSARNSWNRTAEAQRKAAIRHSVYRAAGLAVLTAGVFGSAWFSANEEEKRRKAWRKKAAAAKARKKAEDIEKTLYVDGDIKADDTFDGNLSKAACEKDMDSDDVKNILASL